MIQPGTYFSTKDDFLAVLLKLLEGANTKSYGGYKKITGLFMEL